MEVWGFLGINFGPRSVATRRSRKEATNFISFTTFRLLQLGTCTTDTTFTGLDSPNFHMSNEVKSKVGTLIPFLTWRILASVLVRFYGFTLYSMEKI